MKAYDLADVETSMYNTIQDTEIVAALITMLQTFLHDRGEAPKLWDAEDMGTLFYAVDLLQEQVTALKENLYHLESKVPTAKHSKHIDDPAA